MVETPIVSTLPQGSKLTDGDLMIPSAPRGEDNDNSSATTNITSSSSFSDLHKDGQVQVQVKVESGAQTDDNSRSDLKDLEAGENDDIFMPPLKRAAWVRFTALSMYRRLFSLVFLGNLSAFIYVMVSDRQLVSIINAATANLLALGLARQPLVVNTFFFVFGSISRSAPLFLRKAFAKIYCYGGVHSGCGVAALVWYIGYVGLLTQQYALGDESNTMMPSAAVVGISYVILFLLMLIITAAYPAIRMRLHDWFELLHRFCGWTIIALFWPLLILFSIDAAKASRQSLGRYLVTLPTFWMVILTTLAIVHPWLLLRKIPVKAEVLSTHATRLHFDHTHVDAGQGLSLSKHPLRDWHSFASFPDFPAVPGTSGTTKEHPEFSCLVSKAGDWTADVIANPPTHLWKRAVPLYGFGYVMRVFRRMIVVTTGSGIGPCLSYIGDPDRPAMRVIWQTRAPLKTYGESVLDLVRQLDSDPHIIDTSMQGKRADMLPLVLKMFKDFDAEAICVISNPRLTQQLVYQLEARGVPAFGPIFDS